MSSTETVSRIVFVGWAFIGAMVLALITGAGPLETLTFFAWAVAWWGAWRERRTLLRLLGRLLAKIMVKEGRVNE